LPGVGRIVRIPGFQPSTLNQERIYGQRQPHVAIGEIHPCPTAARRRLLAAPGKRVEQPRPVERIAQRNDSKMRI